MQKNVFHITILLALSLVLAACAGSPPALPVTGPDSTPAAGPAGSSTQAPVASEIPAATSTSPALSAATATVTSPKKNSSAPPSACSQIPLSSAVLFASTLPNGARSTLSALDPTSGQPLCGHEGMMFRGIYNYNFSQDRKRLAVLIADDTGNRPGALKVIDLQSWQEVEIGIDSMRESRGVAFNPAGTQVAIALDTAPQNSNQPPSFSLILFNLAGQNIIAKRDLSFAPTLVRYTSDGSGIMLYGGIYDAAPGTKPQAKAILVDAVNLNTVWQPVLEGVWSGGTQPPQDGSDPIFDIWEPGYALTADGDILYLVHSDEDVLTTVDFAQRKESKASIQPRLSWLERILSWTASPAYAKGMNGTTKQALLSKDGSRLFVLGTTNHTSVDSKGNTQFEQTPLGLQVINPATGEELGKLDTAAYNFYLSPDGSALYLDDWEDPSFGAEVVDADSLKVVQQMDRLNLVATKTIGGQPIVLGQTRFNQTINLDPGSLRPVQGSPENLWYSDGYPLLPPP